MVKLGCSIDGNLNEAKFSEPIPWIGLYIVAASLACVIAMAADVIYGLRQRQFWFPNKYFCINATSLTIIGVAVKLSVDLNTPMPRRVDQLSKVSSGALICVLMGNSMPSLGSMENQEMYMNIIALGILVITVVVNICIQLGTGVIYLYWQEHAFIMLLMLVLLAILSFTALVVPTAKKYLEMKYKKKYRVLLSECSSEVGKEIDRKLREDLQKSWIMAHTSNPEFVVGRSVTCTAAGAFCLVSALILVEAILRSYLMSRSFEFCSGESDYKWSSILILVSQTVTVGVGTIAPATRWFSAVNFRCPVRRNKKHHKSSIFTVEKYWIQGFLENKESPIQMRSKSRHCRKLAHDVRNQLLDLCIGMQKGIVISSKFIQQISIFTVSGGLLFLDFCAKLKFRPLNSIAGNPSGSETQGSLDYSRYVLHLEGEDELVELVKKDTRDVTAHWIRRGIKNQPEKLTELLEKSSGGLHGVENFDSDLVKSLHSDEPLNCWSLPVVTLTAIAFTIPDMDRCSMEKLLSSVHEGLIYLRFMESHLNTKPELDNIRKAAYAVWLRVDLYHKWLDVDLKELPFQAESTKEILQRFSDVAKSKFQEFKMDNLSRCQHRTWSFWPIDVLASNSMYRISQTILQNFDFRKDQTGERLFKELSVMIADILGACLTNLPRLISKLCLSSSFEKREDCVRKAIFLLGKTEKMLKLLDRKTVPSFPDDEGACINHWIELHKKKRSLTSVPSSESNEIAGDLCLTIE